MAVAEVQQVAIAFNDLKAQQRLIREKIDLAISKVLDHGRYVLGPEIDVLEAHLADFCDAKHALSCSNGTDALIMAMLALGIRSGDAVFVPSFTFVSTAEVVVLCNAIPIFVDVLPDTYNIDPNSLKEGIKQAKQQNLNPVGVIAVDIFGQPADYNALREVTIENDLWLIADAAQSFGARYQQKKVGTLADITTTSFFPAKPLGCYGDGGAVFTDNADLVDVMSSIRVHGQGLDKYDNVRIGINGRLDSIQAAVLIEKLKIFPQELIDRQKTASFYTAELAQMLGVPRLLAGVTSSWAQYTLKLPDYVDRDSFMLGLRELGVPTAVYYPIPLHMQSAYLQYPRVTDNLKVCEALADCVVSLPMSGYVTASQAEYIVDAVKQVISKQ